MSTHHTHDKQDHVHTADCAHPPVCTKGHACTEHASDHIHGDDCGHEAVPHGDHMDYLVGSHLHHPHGGHCDDHGRVIA